MVTQLCSSNLNEFLIDCACRIVLQNITNTPIQKFRRLRRLSHDDMCIEILQPPGFGLFDLGINREINLRSPLFQKLQADVKVSFLV